MELKPVRNARNCRTDIEEAERLRDTHATGEVFCQRRESANYGRTMTDLISRLGVRYLADSGHVGDLPL